MEAEYRVEVQEMFIDHVLDKTDFTYALGCYGQPGCKNRYDCSGLMHSFLNENGIQVRKINSSGAYSKSKKRTSVYEAQRGDLLYFTQYYGEGYPRHLAIVAEVYTGGYITIIDNVSPSRRTTIERKIKIGRGGTYNLPDQGFNLVALDNVFVNKYIDNKPLNLKECDNVCTNIYKKLIASLKEDAGSTTGNQQKEVNIFAQDGYQTDGHRQAASDLRELLSI